MKKFVFCTALVMCALMASPAHAVSLLFDFNVYSSGPSMYPCNAGIIAQDTSATACYFAGTNQSCSPGDCMVPGPNCQSQCECASSNGGKYLMNFGRATYQDWTDHGVTDVHNRVENQTFRAAAANQPWSQLLPDSVAMSKRISNLSFELGSEMYTAKYFVDICYRGPQIDYSKSNAIVNFALSANVFANDFVLEGPQPGENSTAGLNFNTLSKYTVNSGLKVQAFVACDLQGVGSYKEAANTSGGPNTSENEAGFNFGTLGTPVSAVEGSGSFWYSSPMGLAGTSAQLFQNNYIVNNSTLAPRFCVVRYIFTETNSSSSQPSLRKWQLEGAQMCTKTDITEGIKNL